MSVHACSSLMPPVSPASAPGRVEERPEEMNIRLPLLTRQEGCCKALVPVSIYPISPVVIFYRSHPRVNGVMCVAVEIGGEVQKWRVESFINEGVFVNETVHKMVKDWKSMAEKYPNSRRKCIECNRRAVKGKIICGHCKKNSLHDIIYN